MDKTNVMVEFTMYGDKLIPDVVTRRLGITPTLQGIKGDVIEGRSFLRRSNIWQLSTGYEESFDINDQLVKIYDLLKSKVDILKELREQYNLEYFIYIVPQIVNNETPAMSLERWFIDFVHEIRADIEIDLYIYS